MCTDIKIKQVNLETHGGKEIIIKSDDYNIGVLKSKYKITSGNLEDVPFQDKYEIYFNGKYDVDELDELVFCSDEWYKKFNELRNSDLYKKSFESLEKMFFDDFGEFYFKKEFSFIDVNDKKYIINDGSFYRLKNNESLVEVSFCTKENGLKDIGMSIP